MLLSAGCRAPEKQPRVEERGAEGEICTGEANQGWFLPSRASPGRSLWCVVCRAPRLTDRCAVSAVLLLQEHSWSSCCGDGRKLSGEV